MESIALYDIHGFVRTSWLSPAARSNFEYDAFCQNMLENAHMGRAGIANFQKYDHYIIPKWAGAMAGMAPSLATPLSMLCTTEW